MLTGLAETALAFELVFVPATVAGFAEAETETALALGTVFIPGTVTGFAEDADAETLFAGELAFGVGGPAFAAVALTETAGFGPEFAAFGVAEAFTDTAAAFGTEVAGFPVAVAFTDTDFFCAT